jgi:hypothetical protein
MTSIYQIDQSTSLEDIKHAGQMKGTDMGLQAAQEIDADSYDDAADAIDGLIEDSGESWEHFKCMSPFEFVASALNKRDDALDAWEALESSFHAAFSLTVGSKKETIQDSIDERIFDEDCEKVRNLWPEIKQSIIDAYSEDDDVAINESFNDWTDSLCKDGEISGYTYDNITREDVE